MIIAEIGNNHFGDFNTAKTMIRIAKNSGATLVKLQAFQAEDIKVGSMTRDFYKQCEFSFQQYVELIHYGDDIGVPVFYSIFSKSLEKLGWHESFHKIAHSQVSPLNVNLLKETDSGKTFVSMKRGAFMPDLKHSTVMFVSDYLEEKPDLEEINLLRKHYGRRCGYSDHTEGPESAIKAIKEFGACVVEKHFTLEKNIKFGSNVFRDTVHGALPYELEYIAKQF